MDAEEQIGQLVIRLSNLKLELNGVLADAQDDLRQYVVSHQYPLEDRFEVWAEWCVKNHYNCITEADVPLIGKMIENGEPSYYERYDKFTWNFFLEYFTDNHGCDKMWEKYGVTVDDVKEFLIQQNFGSFMMDW